MTSGNSQQSQHQEQLFLNFSSHENAHTESNSDQVTLLGGTTKSSSSSNNNNNKYKVPIIYPSSSSCCSFYRFACGRLQYSLSRLKMCFLIGLCIFLVATFSSVIESQRSEGSSKFSEFRTALNGRNINWEQQQERQSSSNHLDTLRANKKRQDYQQYPWTFVCVDNKCQRQLANERQKVSFDVCWLTCGQAGPLWPMPGEVKLSPTTARFYPENFFIRDIKGPNDYTKGLANLAANLTRMELKKMLVEHGTNSVTRSADDEPRYQSPDSTIIEVHLSSEEPVTSLSETTDESYELRISSVTMGTGALINVNIKGATFFGIRHGLETLSQLIAYDEIGQCLHIVDDVTIRDGPAYPIRGLMLDTARNYIPIDSIYRMVDAMSYNKMNTLHWHLTDSNSFPFQSKQVPQMSIYGAYEPKKVYTMDEIKSLVFYALVKGVRIIPELDAPAHAGNGWQWGLSEGLGELAVCVGQEPWRNYCGQPPCGQLNPMNPNVYEILQKLYEDMLDAFQTDLFHIGGDEVLSPCWDRIPGMREFMNDHRLPSYMDTWGYFQEKAYHRLKAANKGKPITAMVWSSGLTGSSSGKKFLDPRNFYIQIWESSTSYQITELLKNNYKLIFSNVDAMYLDMGAGSWLGTEHVYKFHNWQTFYDNDLDNIVSGSSHRNGKVASQYAKQVLGGIATLWSEKVDENNMDVRLWPRGAASAERLWTNPKKRRDDTVYARLNLQTKRLKSRGIHCSTLQPESCLQMTGNCDDPAHPM